jgi:hypothetical protein
MRTRSKDLVLVGLFGYYVIPKVKPDKVENKSFSSSTLCRKEEKRKRG